jgi:TRAP-type uncharacterized transport system substrate-binding protein
MEKSRKTGFGRFLGSLMEMFGLSRAMAIAAVLLTAFVVAIASYWFVHSAPPRTLTITGGPPGSTFETNAMRYAQILRSNGVTLKIIPSEGSQQNLQRLEDSTYQVDIGFVQGGVTNLTNSGNLFSLGSVSYQPLLIFYRGSNSLSFLSDFQGKRLAIGPVGSGTRALALTLLGLNGIQPGGPTKLLDLEAGEAAKALMADEADAAFLMGDSASSVVMRQLLHEPGIHMFNFAQADGYTRRISYLNKLELPKGSIDFGKNVPANDVNLVGPTVELLARKKLHPALSDLLLEAARDVHGGAKLLQRKNEFPAPLENEYPISPDATRYYKSGKSFLYRSLPFWLASLVNRALAVFLPVVVVLIPGLKLMPTLFRLRTKLLFYRQYRALLRLEHELRGPQSAGKREELLAELDGIERGVHKMKVPASFADQFYGLREHIEFVREKFGEQPEPPEVQAPRR